MGNERALYLGVLNVKTQPHSTDEYIDLFKAVFKAGRPAKIWGPNWGLFGSMFSEEFENSVLLYGHIFKFLNINPRDEWLNINDRTTIKVEKDELPPVPENLKPQLRRIPYVFFPQQHRIFFDYRYISHALMQKLIITLLYNSIVSNKFSQIDVCVETSRQALERILQIKRLSSIDISFTIPNNDSINESDVSLMVARIEDQYIETFKQEVKSNSDKGIVPDKYTKTYMEIARSNGVVTVKGYEDEKKVVFSTKDHPLKKTIKYDHRETNQLDALIRASVTMLPTL